jgi:ATP-dependent DNA ligase
VVLDGEATCFTNGMHDFDKLWSNCFDETVRLSAFDLLELNGEDYRAKPLAERKKRLARLLARPGDGIEYVEHLEGDGGRIFEHACKLGWKALCRSALIWLIAPAPRRAGSRSKTQSTPP